MRNAKKPQKPATMRDVARLAGVSQPTVSRVLNSADTAISISEETRSKVLAAVEELNYRTNMLARGLRTQQTQMLAVLIADISNSFYHPIVRAIQDVAREHNYDVMIANSDHIYDNERHFCEAVTRRPVDGVIMVPMHLTDEDLDDFITRTNTPLAVLGRHVQHPYIDVVYVDDEQAIYDVTMWLVQEQHHKSVGYVGVPDNLPPGPRRYRGFQRAMMTLHMKVQPEHLVISDFTMEGGKTAAQKMLQSGNLPSAVLVLNDLMAIGAILAFQEAGLRIPDDIAVVGFDNIPECEIVRPGLTTIAQDSLDLGHKLATCIFDRLDNPDLPTRRLESPMTLVKRESA